VSEPSPPRPGRLFAAGVALGLVAVVGATLLMQYCAGG
jgi:uncharacterized protein involved in exopolysaccharide biosynthesis